MTYDASKNYYHLCALTMIWITHDKISFNWESSDPTCTPVRNLPSATVCIRLGYIWHLWSNTILMVFWWRYWLYRVQHRLFSLSRFKIAQAVPKKIRDPATNRQFQSALTVKTNTVAAVSTAAGSDSDTANRVDSTWSKLKKPLQDSTTEVCGPSNSYQWLPETWWWNGQVD